MSCKSFLTQFLFSIFRIFRRAKATCKYIYNLYSLTFSRSAILNYYERMNEKISSTVQVYLIQATSVTHIKKIITCLCLFKRRIDRIFPRLTFVAQTKHVVTTFEITFMRFFVSCMTLSTFVNVAAFPTVGFFTVNCSC